MKRLLRLAPALLLAGCTTILGRFEREGDAAELAEDAGVDHASDGAADAGDGAPVEVDGGGHAGTCEDPIPLPDRAETRGTNAGGTSIATPSCGGFANGKLTVYKVTPTTTGTLRMTIFDAQGGATQFAYAQPACQPALDDPGCDEYVGLANATAGVPLFVFVRAGEETYEGPFRLSVASHPITCGDAFIDALAGELCDPPAPGVCSSDCKTALGLTEKEPNDTTALANEYEDGFVGLIDGYLDTDTVRFVVPDGKTRARVRIFDRDGTSCPSDALGISLLGGNGQSIQDLYGCAAIDKPVSAGPYFAQVVSFSLVRPIGYVLSVELL